MILVPITLHEDIHATKYSSKDCQSLLEAYRAFYPKIGYFPPWIGFFVEIEEEIVGSCGFTGPPKSGTVEIAYWTFSAHEGKGIASWCCAQLVWLTTMADPSLVITAKTAPQNNASTQILTKNGFRFLEVTNDHEIGDAWLWKHQLTHES